MTIPSKLALALSSSALALCVAACSDPVGDAPRATVAEAAPTVTDDKPAAPGALSFNQEGSRVDWVGAKVTGMHDGGFRAFSGSIEGTTLESAKVSVDIDTSTLFADNPKLEGHLKSPDFFDVAQFPKARFVSSSIVPAGDGVSTVTGNLTLHGVTKELSFPATITLSDEGATAKADFGINRKDFGIVYPGAPDDLINDEVLLKLDIRAKR
jgi:polyisoprenoid-binding protein YceI